MRVVRELKNETGASSKYNTEFRAAASTLRSSERSLFSDTRSGPGTETLILPITRTSSGMVMGLMSSNNVGFARPGSRLAEVLSLEDIQSERRQIIVAVVTCADVTPGRIQRQVACTASPATPHGLQGPVCLTTLLSPRPTCYRDRLPRPFSSHAWFREGGYPPCERTWYSSTSELATARQKSLTNSEGWFITSNYFSRSSFHSSSVSLSAVRASPTAASPCSSAACVNRLSNVKHRADLKLQPHSSHFDSTALS